MKPSMLYMAYITSGHSLWVKPFRWLHTNTVGPGKIVLLCVHEVKKQEYFKEASTSSTFIIAISSCRKWGSETSKATLVNPRNGQSWSKNWFVNKTNEPTRPGFSWAPLWQQKQYKPFLSTQVVPRIWCALESCRSGCEPLAQALDLARSVPGQLRGHTFSWLLSRWSVGYFAWSVDTQTWQWSWQRHGTHASYIWFSVGNKIMNIRWAAITRLSCAPHLRAPPPTSNHTGKTWSITEGRVPAPILDSSSVCSGDGTI